MSGAQGMFICPGGRCCCSPQGPGESAESPAGRVPTQTLERATDCGHQEASFLLGTLGCDPSFLCPKGAGAQLSPLSGGVTLSRPAAPRPHTRAGAGRLPQQQPPPPLLLLHSETWTGASGHPSFPGVPCPLAPCTPRPPRSAEGPRWPQPRLPGFVFLVLSLRRRLAPPIGRDLGERDRQFPPELECWSRARESRCAALSKV